MGLLQLQVFALCSVLTEFKTCNFYFVSLWNRPKTQIRLLKTKWVNDTNGLNMKYNMHEKSAITYHFTPFPLFQPLLSRGKHLFSWGLFLCIFWRRKKVALVSAFAPVSYLSGGFVCQNWRVKIHELSSTLSLLLSKNSVLALLRFIDPLNRSFDPKKFDKHGIKGSIITLITIDHHIHVSKFVKILIFLTPWR